MSVGPPSLRPNGPNGSKTPQPIYPAPCISTFTSVLLFCGLERVFLFLLGRPHPDTRQAPDTDHEATNSSLSVLLSREALWQNSGFCVVFELHASVQRGQCVEPRDGERVIVVGYFGVPGLPLPHNATLYMSRVSEILWCLPSYRLFFTNGQFTIVVQTFSFRRWRVRKKYNTDTATAGDPTQSYPRRQTLDIDATDD